MLYSQSDRDEVITRVKKRSMIVWVPAAAMLALAIAAFVLYRLRHDESGWIVSAAFTILGGAYAVFFYGVYLRPMRKYKRHLDYMLDGRKRVTEGILKEVSETVQDRDGVDCRCVLMNVGDKDDPEDDRLFYLDAFKSMEDFQAGDRVRIESNDRMIAGILKI
jgi:hypothetical protein